MGLTVPKWVLINWPKVPQMPQNSSAQIVCPSLKVWYFDEKRLWYVVLRKYKASSRIFPSVICRQLWSTVLYYWELRAVSTKGAFNNYVDKMKGEGGRKMSVVVHVVVECPLIGILHMKFFQISKNGAFHVGTIRYLINFGLKIVLWACRANYDEY